MILMKLKKLYLEAEAKKEQLINEKKLMTKYKN